MLDQTRLTLLLFGGLACACTSTEASRDYHAYETKGGQRIELEALIEEISGADAVFLGEEHDNDVGHRLQLQVIMALADLRPDLIVSMEQFEADTQSVLDLYMAGAVSEQYFLEHSRPWGNYAEHYAPIVEFARGRHIPVIAANIPRPMARTVWKQGLNALDGVSLAPAMVWVDDPLYAERFADFMGLESADQMSASQRRAFAAQCIKDEKMAQSISRELVRSWARGEQPLVVHLDGKFHSDYGLGTVSRLKRRHPVLDVRVISMNSDEDRARPLRPEELKRGDYVWLVRPQP